MMPPRIGFAGLSHLGIISAIATAAQGFAVSGYDPDRRIVAGLSAGAAPIAEPGLDTLLAANAARLQFGDSPAVLASCDIVYISADVPTDATAKSDLGPIGALIDAVAPVLPPDGVLVVLCQVPPGFTRRIAVVPPQRLFYQVETLIFGRAVERACHPERFIVGCADPARPLARPYRVLLESFGCPILPMRYESAELAKVAINFFLVASVTTANVLAEVSETIGADWAEVIPALRLDQRIGPFAYLNPGLGIAGGNLERDLQTVLDLAEKAPVDRGVIEAWRANSRRRKDWCWQRLNASVLARKPDARIAILGLAYKENTHSTKNSAALDLVGRLEGRDVRVHDPVVSAVIVPFATGCVDPISCAQGADALVVATPWPEYRNIALEDLARVMKGRVLVDPYRLLDGAKAAAKGFEYHALGMPPLMPV